MGPNLDPDDDLKEGGWEKNRFIRRKRAPGLKKADRLISLGVASGGSEGAIGNLSLIDEAR